MINIRNTRYSQKEFEDKVRLFGKENYVFLDSYLGMNKKIRCKHIVCGFIFSIKPSYFVYRHRGCPICSSNMKQTTETFKFRVHKLVGNEYSVLSKYANANTKISMKHNICGNIFTVLPTDFVGKAQHRCPVCSKNNFQNKYLRKAEEEYSISKQLKSFQDWLDVVYPNKYLLLSEYINSSTKVKIKHIPCGSIFEITPYNLYYREICKWCSFHKIRIQQPEFIKRIENVCNNDYTFLDKYKGSDIKIRCKHLNCGNVWKVTPHNFIFNHSRCPNCSNPYRGEEYIQRFLLSRSIKFIPQKYFCDLIDKQPLSYDFCLPNKKILIEFQGEQHYRPIEYFGGIDKFAVQNLHDDLKRDYANRNGYKLIEISYKLIKNKSDEDSYTKIKEVLTQKLKELV